MRSIPRTLLLLVAMVAVPAQIVACGGGSDSSNADADSSADNENGPTPAEEATAEELGTRAVEFLLGQYNASSRLAWGDEVTSGPFHVGTNAMVLNGLLRGPRPVLPSADERVRKTLDALRERAYDNPYGIVWSSPAPAYAVYESAVALRAFVEAARLDATWREEANADDLIRRVRSYLLSAQIDEIQEFGFEDDFQVEGPEHDLGEFYGGWGYGQVRRENRAPANLSTTNLAMESLYESFRVVEGDDAEREQFAAAQQKLQNFLRNVHNLREYQGSGGRTVQWNDRVVDTVHDPRDAEMMGDPDDPRMMAGTDGGAMYSPGSSKAGFGQMEGGLFTPRSYGSMTYALLRLYLMSGISSQDPRVQAAYDWVRQAENYTWDVNPGFDMDGSKEFYGLYYYYYTAADTLARLAPDGNLVDTRGQDHNWRDDMTRALARAQNDDGSWQNPEPRWNESDMRLATAYALIALGFATEPPARN